ncbi:MAG: hypothetical protein AAB885_02960 [Patescibacteria group bacterium]
MVKLHLKDVPQLNFSLDPLLEVMPFTLFELREGNTKKEVLLDLMDTDEIILKKIKNDLARAVKVKILGCGHIKFLANEQRVLGNIHPPDFDYSDESLKNMDNVAKNLKQIISNNSRFYNWNVSFSVSKSALWNS